MSLDTEAKPSPQAVDLTGLRIGPFRVVKRHGLQSRKGPRTGNWAWIVQCTKCEETYSQLGTHLVTGRRTRCARCGFTRQLTDAEIGRISRRKAKARGPHFTNEPGQSPRSLNGRLEDCEGQIEWLKQRIASLTGQVEALTDVVEELSS